ncbi:RH1 [Ovine adenovirus 7]|uniref:RH1 n=1 Tax=Ovine adenovirus D serotype 7 (isolate OAV287) TaxID=114430 RepID=Q83921_ADEO7|nr:RH1 [Ovine adenovirus 7]AAB29334.1 RH1 [Ovine adenovirus 7]
MIAFLPLEIWFEIFLYLPIADLVVFASVFREFLPLLYSTAFRRRYFLSHRAKFPGLSSSPSVSYCRYCFGVDCPTCWFDPFILFNFAPAEIGCRCSAHLYLYYTVKFYF